MRISDWSSDVCSSDLRHDRLRCRLRDTDLGDELRRAIAIAPRRLHRQSERAARRAVFGPARIVRLAADTAEQRPFRSDDRKPKRSEEHTSELQSLMRISYAVFCLKKNKNNNDINTNELITHINTLNQTTT